MKIDLLDGALYAGDPDPVYAWLRENAPVYHDEENALWGISRHADICDIERDQALWTSTGGYRPQIPSDPSMIGMDDPEHALRRRTVYRRFTPRSAGRYIPKIRETVDELLNRALDEVTVDAIPALAAPLPARMIGWLLGFPEEEWSRLADWSQRAVVAGGGRRYITDDATIAAGEFAQAVLDLARKRRRCPGDDLLSVWCDAGALYDDEHLAHEALLLLVGGAETTRTVIAATIDALIRHPAQWRRLRSDPGLIEGAVEEFIRWTTPILNMCRTATRTTSVAGTMVPAGAQVLLMYGSANRDEAVFDRPVEFDVGRGPGGHIAFGLGGHFCLGAALARLELRVFFTEFVRRVRAASWSDREGPRMLPNAFVRGITSFPVTLHGL